MLCSLKLDGAKPLKEPGPESDSTVDIHLYLAALLGRSFGRKAAVRLRMHGPRRVVVHSQFGMTPEERRFFECLGTWRQKPFRLIRMGRLLPWKGIHLGLLAFAKLQESHPDSEYWIINDGIEIGRLKGLVRKPGVEEKLTFWGKLPTLQDVYGKLAECDVLVHPALHEAFGNVCLEALASGRSVICLDLGGPGLQVKEEQESKWRRVRRRQQWQG